MIKWHIHEDTTPGVMAQLEQGSGDGVIPGD